jgi:transcriptional regulator
MPFLLYPDEGKHGVLRAHMARANPHWKDLSGLGQCLIVFQGPEGYVTPSWYPSKTESHKVVPTWNYAMVQAWGKPSVIADASWLRKQLDDLTNHHEKTRPEPWSVGDAPADFIANQMKAIVGIEIPIERLEGKFKMSQNRTDLDRTGVLEGIANPDDCHFNPGVARLVKGATRPV